MWNVTYIQNYMCIYSIEKYLYNLKLREQPNFLITFPLPSLLSIVLLYLLYGVATLHVSLISILLILLFLICLFHSSLCFSIIHVDRVAIVYSFSLLYSVSSCKCMPSLLWNSECIKTIWIMFMLLTQFNMKIHVFTWENVSECGLFHNIYTYIHRCIFICVCICMCVYICYTCIHTSSIVFLN